MVGASLLFGPSRGGVRLQPRRTPPRERGQKVASRPRRMYNKRADFHLKVHSVPHRQRTADHDGEALLPVRTTVTQTAHCKETGA